MTSPPRSKTTFRPSRARDSPRLARRRSAEAPRPRGSDLRARVEEGGRCPTGFASSPTPARPPARAATGGGRPPAPADREAGWEVQDVPTASACAAGVTPTRELVYGRRPVREVLRAAAVRCSSSWWGTGPPRRALAPRRDRPPDPGAAGVGLDCSGRNPGPPGVVAVCEPYGYADAYELAAGERSLLVCLDQVTDLRNLGAIARSAEGAGATGLVVPEHNARSRLRSAVVSRSCRAPGRRGGREPEPLPERGQARRPLGLGGRRRRATVWKADFTTGAALVFGVREEGSQARRSARLRRRIRDPLAGRVESLNVSVAAGTPFEAATAPWLRRCTCSTAGQPLHAGFAEPQALVDRLAGFVAVRGARGSSSSTAKEPTRPTAPSRCAMPRRPTISSSVSRPSTVDRGR